VCKISSPIASSREATAHEPHMVGLVDSQPCGAARVMKDEHGSGRRGLT
jgi:hypothetical protein